MFNKNDVSLTHSSYAGTLTLCNKKETRGNLVSMVSDALFVDLFSQYHCQRVAIAITVPGRRIPMFAYGTAIIDLIQDHGESIEQFTVGGLDVIAVMRSYLEEKVSVVVSLCNLPNESHVLYNSHDYDTTYLEPLFESADKVTMSSAMPHFVRLFSDAFICEELRTVNVPTRMDASMLQAFMAFVIMASIEAGADRISVKIAAEIWMAKFLELPEPTCRAFSSYYLELGHNDLYLNCMLDAGRLAGLASEDAMITKVGRRLLRTELPTLLELREA